MAKHLMEVAELVHRLVALGDGLQEHWIVAIILSSLPRSYDAIITTLESRPVVELNQDYVKGKLLDEWRRRSENAESERAMRVFTHRSSADGERNKQRPRQWNCYCCKKLGHFWRDCPKLSVSEDDEHEEEAKATVQRKSPRQDGNICFNATGGGGDCSENTKKPSSEAWYLDSGCMMHMTGRAELLEGLVSCRREIVLADGRKMLATAIGTGRLNMQGENGKESVIIGTVLFVPGLAENLLSVGRIVERGYEVNFKYGECRISIENKTVVVGKRQDGLYVVQ